MASDKPWNEVWVVEALKPATPETVRALIRDGKVLAFTDDDSIVLAQDRGDGDCEWHWFFRPKMPMSDKRARLRPVVQSLIASGFRCGIGMTPRHNLPARIFNRAMGAQRVGEKEGGLLYFIDLNEWLAKNGE